jgi:hypothetical protein
MLAKKGCLLKMQVKNCNFFLDFKTYLTQKSIFIKRISLIKALFFKTKTKASKKSK